MDIVGLEKYRRKEQPNKNLSFIERVNQQIPIQTLFQDEFGLYLPEDIPRSWKTYCPWSWEHPDGGTDKTMRVYPSNTAYCFAMHGLLTPVKIIQVQKEWGAVRAARWLSERYGLEIKRPYWERINQLVLERELKGTSSGSLAHAAEALHRALSGVDGYDQVEFDERVLASVDEQLRRLDSVPEGSIREWLQDSLARVTTVVQQCIREV